ncbi:MAG TPA: hypothetical protein VGK02_02720 [Candidatus Aquicultor sp.]|jgi:hypothetical protein
MTTSALGINSSGSSAVAQAAAKQPNVTQAKTPTPQPQKTQENKDTVHISTAAQARALKHAGQTASQIASSLGLDVKTVDAYLGIKNQTVAPAVQVNSTAEEAKESGAMKAAETLQGQ